MNEDYKIRFSSLKDGFHNFDYKVGNEFFEHIEYSEIKHADLDVNISLEKKSTMMILNFKINGKVEVMCDRCTDDFYLDVHANDELIYKFGEEDLDDDKVIMVYPNEIEIDISHPIYEFTILALPNRRLHKEGECNQDMLKEMDSYLLVEDQKSEPTSNDSDTEENEEYVDPRWSALNKLKNKNK